MIACMYCSPITTPRECDKDFIGFIFLKNLTYYRYLIHADNRLLSCIDYDLAGLCM